MRPRLTKLLPWCLALPIILSLPQISDAQCDPAWEEVLAGVGFDGIVWDAAVYGGALYVCGEFDNIIDSFAVPITSAAKVARWDGVSWSAVGTFPFDNTVFELEVVDLGDGAGPLLYAGGLFTGRLATWDGASWTTFPVLPPNNLRAITAIGNQLFIGGAFNQDGVRAFNGVSWTALGAGLERDPADGTGVNPAPTVFDLQVFEGFLYAAGNFTCALDDPLGALDCAANGVPGTYRIARWTGAQWESVDGGVGVGANIQKLTVFDVDEIPSLIAGGRFDDIGGVLANNIAAWNTITGWQAIGGPLGVPSGNAVLALALFDDLSGGSTKLHAGGNYNTPAVRVASYDGAPGGVWTSLDGGAGGSVRALVSHNDGSGPALYVGGEFTAVDGGGLTVQRIARYRAAMGADCNSNSITDSCEIDFLLTPDCNENGVPDDCDIGATSVDCNLNGIPDECEVAAGTQFDCNNNLLLDSCEIAGGGVDCNANGIPDACDLAFGGASDDCDGSGLPDECDIALGVTDDNADGVPDSCQGVACAPTWDTSIPGVDTQIWASTVFGGDLVIGGEFILDATGALTLNGIAYYDGVSLHALGDGFDARPRVLEVLDLGDGFGPRLYVGGDFTLCGTEPCLRVAVWNGTGWEQVGDGLTANCLALEVYQGELYAGGNFGQRIRRLVGGTWLPLIPGGPTGGTNGTVFSLEVFDEGLGAGPELFVGGNFECVADTDLNCLGATAVAALNIGKWNGTSWSTVGGGILGTAEYVWTVNALDLGDGPKLYAGGSFTFAELTTSNSIAVWSDDAIPGTYEWSALGNGVLVTGATAVVRDIAAFDDGSGTGTQLYIGGNFNQDGSGNVVRRIARFQGGAWVEPDAGVSGQILGLQNYTLNGERGLVTIGNLTAASGDPADMIATWKAAHSLDVDCNGNGVPDDCEIASGAVADCNNNGTPDDCDMLLGFADCDVNGELDFCQIVADPSLDLNLDGWLDSCLIPFVRGDSNLDSMIDIGDVITVLTYLFLNGTAPACEDSFDSSDDDAIDIGDAIWVVNYLFLSGLPPFLPFPSCGTDPSGNLLDCDSYPPCL